LIALQQEPCAQGPDVHRRSRQILARDIRYLDFSSHVTRQSLVALCVTHLRRAVLPDRKTEVHDLVADVLVEVDRHGRWIIVGYVERRTVREHARGCAYRQFANTQHVAVDLEFLATPAVRRQAAAAALHELLQVADLLLKVLWSEKQPL
jgi:hypothetical protein